MEQLYRTFQLFHGQHHPLVVEVVLWGGPGGWYWRVSCVRALSSDLISSSREDSSNVSRQLYSAVNLCD